MKNLYFSDSGSPKRERPEWMSSFQTCIRPSRPSGCAGAVVERATVGDSRREYLNPDSADVPADWTRETLTAGPAWRLSQPSQAG